MTAGICHFPIFALRCHFDSLPHFPSLPHHAIAYFPAPAETGPAPSPLRHGASGRGEGRAKPSGAMGPGDGQERLSMHAGVNYAPAPRNHTSCSRMAHGGRGRSGGISNPGRRRKLRPLRGRVRCAAREESRPGGAWRLPCVRSGHWLRALQSRRQGTSRVPEEGFRSVLFRVYVHSQNVCLDSARTRVPFSAPSHLGASRTRPPPFSLRLLPQG